MAPPTEDIIRSIAYNKYEHKQIESNIMPTITLGDAQRRLADIIHRLTPGDEIVITEGDRPIARILPAAQTAERKPRQPGTLRGTVLFMADDFDAPLEDFRDYTDHS